jgi:hypothetical protein
MNADSLEVRQVYSLQVASHTAARVDLPDLAGSDVRSVLDGTRPARELAGVTRQRGPYGDLVSTFWAALFLVSDRFVAALSEGLTGWEVSPVTITDGPPLSLLHVFGCSGPILAQEPITGDIGQYLDPQTWDGSDLFLPKNHNGILLTRQAKDVLAGKRLRNVLFEPAGLLPLKARL